jgi:hypothetical protein
MWQQAGRVSRVVGLMAIGLSYGATAQAQWSLQLAEDPAEASFVTEDIHNFLRAYDRLASEVDTLAVLQEEYLDKGTPGLRAFTAKYDLTAERLREAIRDESAAYTALALRVQVLEQGSQIYRQAYADLKHHIPGAVFPPTHFLVGAYRGIGSGSEVGTLVTIENRSEASLRGDLTTVLVHEMVHMQQALAMGPEKYQAIYGLEKSLLALTIREGIAEYFADLVTGRMTQEHARGFVLDNETALWERFTHEMLETDDGDWMWATPKDPAQPLRVGYVLGALITQAYYENADDKAKAIRDILSVTDYPAFLERSGYEPGTD